jgi:hypothetical protein
MQVTVSYPEHEDAWKRENTDIVSKQRSDNLIVSRWESSPSGIDWEMIRSVRKTNQSKKGSIE